MTTPNTNHLKPLAGDSLVDYFEIPIQLLERSAVHLADFVKSSQSDQDPAIRELEFLLLDTRSLLVAIREGYVKNGQPRITRNTHEFLRLASTVDPDSDALKSAQSDLLEFYKWVAEVGATAEDHKIDAQREAWKTRWL